MRSHATTPLAVNSAVVLPFPYRKRYEVTCDDEEDTGYGVVDEFPYRKRYEVTCDS